MTGSLVVAQELVDGVGPPPPGVCVIPAVPRPRRRWSRCDAPDCEPIVLCLAAAPGSAVVLARPIEVDPGWSTLRQVAATLGRPLITLQPDPLEAAWTAAVAFGLVDTEPERLIRMLEVLAIGPDLGPGLPRRPWRDGRPVPALRPMTLGRWAECAWRACPWCAGGGIPGTRCGRCLAPLPVEPPA